MTQEFMDAELFADFIKFSSRDLLSSYLANALYSESSIALRELLHKFITDIMEGKYDTNGQKIYYYNNLRNFTK